MLLLVTCLGLLGLLGSFPELPVSAEFRSFQQRDLSILLVVFNKAHYLNRSLTSIYRTLASRSSRAEVVVVDDGSRDNPGEVLERFRESGFRLVVVRHGWNKGTHITRIDSVLCANTEFILFLDPDDELFGNGAISAWDFAQSKGCDIVEFGCAAVWPNRRTRGPCLKTPSKSHATVEEYRNLYFSAKINCHLHRKVFRTALYQRAIAAMPPFVRRARVVRFEDKLQLAFLVNEMTSDFYFLNVVGELRYEQLPDNSQSGYYQSKKQNSNDNNFVNKAIVSVFGRVAV